MKKEIHPPYQDVLFVDSSTGYKFVCGSTLQPKEKVMHEGRELPQQIVPVSSASHPFFTRGNQLMDTEGRVEKFTKRYQAKPQKKVEIEEPLKVGKKDGKQSRPAAKKAKKS